MIFVIINAGLLAFQFGLRSTPGFIAFNAAMLGASVGISVMSRAGG